MTYASSILIPKGSAGIFHCVSRCVRRAVLCGDVRLLGRSFVHQVLGSSTAYDEELASRAALIVSELAGNAVVHAGSPYTVRIAAHGDVVRGEVRDEDRHLPTPRSTTAARASSAPGGHGGHVGRCLGIVEAMADRWES